MVEVTQFINDVMGEIDKDQTKYRDTKEKRRDLIAYLISFGYIEEGKMKYDDEIKEHRVEADDEMRERLKIYLLVHGQRESYKVEVLLQLLSKKWPTTYMCIISFMEHKKHISSKFMYKLLLNLLFFQKKEINEYDAVEVTAFYSTVQQTNMATVTELYGELITHLVHENLVPYNVSFKRKMIKHKQNNAAYSRQEYEILYNAVFNQVNWKKHNLRDACKNDAKVVSMLLYMSIAMENALRESDIVRFPRLTMDDSILKVFVEQIYADTISATEMLNVARSYVRIVIGTLETISKTNEPLVEFSISSEFLPVFGWLLVLRETFCRKEEAEGRIVKFIEGVNQYFGVYHVLGQEAREVIGDRLSIRRLNKARLQLDALTADEIAQKGGLECSGYIVAALHRGHKNTPGGRVSSATAVYLQDGRFDNIDVNVITKNMMQRGVLSVQIYSLLDVLDSSFKNLSVEEQTTKICTSALSALDAELSVALKHMNYDVGIMVLQEIFHLYSSNPVKGVRMVLDSFETGEAQSKMPNIYCLRHAMGMGCCQPHMKSCIGCKYEVLTLAMVYQLNDSLRLMSVRYMQAKTETTKEKLEAGITVIQTVLKEILQLQERECLSEEKFQLAFQTTRETIQQTQTTLAEIKERRRLYDYDYSHERNE